MIEPRTLADLQEDQVYTPKQIAEVLQVPSRRIAQAFREGNLAGIELGPKTIRITGQAVREWLSSKKQPTNLADSSGEVVTSPMGNGVSMSKGKVKSVKDLVLGSL